MKKCLVRERIDFEENPRCSYMHKVWDDGTVEYYMIMAENNDIRWIAEPEWLAACKTHEPQATYVNSAWGDGLPGAGAIWEDIPAWERN